MKQEKAMEKAIEKGIENVTERKETEVKTEGKIYEVDSGKLLTLHSLLAECIKLARETVEGEFGHLAPLKDGSLGKLTCDLAIALFHKASVPDQTETMLVALERGLEWYSAREEDQKAESAKIDQDFKASIQDIAFKMPPRIMSPSESLMRSLLDFATRYSEKELRELSDKPREVPQTQTGGEVPTPEE